jgi:hypothetical protein
MHWDHEHHCHVRKRRGERYKPGMRWEWFCVNPECNQYGVSDYWKRTMRGALEHVYTMRLVEIAVLGTEGRKALT